MNEALKNLVERRSVRSYESRQITEDELQAVLEAGLYAPTARDNQKPLMVVVQDPSDIAELEKLNAAESKSNQKNPFYGAPTLIVVLADPELATWIDDGALVMGNLLNGAHAVGLGSCWINRAREVFDKPAGKEWLKKWGVPEHYRGIGNCILGYVKGDMPAPHERKDGRIIRA